MKSIKAKTILSAKSKSSRWFGTNYTINLYRGCHHGCIYCDSRSLCYKNTTFDTVKVKENAIEIFNKELSSKKSTGVIGIGAMSDTYNKFEEELLVTRLALERIYHYGFGISLETKSDLVVRDIDIIKKIQNKHSAIIKLTITTADDELSKKIEPGVCVSSKRFEALRRLSEAGIFCGVLLGPTLPFITDTVENIEEIVRLSAEAGADFIYFTPGVTLRDIQRKHYFDKIDTLYPGLSTTYLSTYGYNYACWSKDTTKLKRKFQASCKKYNLLYKMDDIIDAYSRKEPDQLSLF